MSKNKITSVSLKTTVTAVKFFKDWIIGGIGGELHYWSWKPGLGWHLQNSVTVFAAQSIHGIRPGFSDDELVIFGGKAVALIHFSAKREGEIEGAEVEVEATWACDDWILDAAASPLKGRTTLMLTANNALHSYSSAEAKVTSKVTCHQRSILYCGEVVIDRETEVLVLAGTVLSEIILWRASDSTVIHTLAGHKGVIMSVHYEEASRRICSTSDDRSVRVWTSSSSSLSASSFSLSCSFFAHTARVWSSVFLPDGTIVSVGEDSMVCQWDVGGLVRQWSSLECGGLWSVDHSGGWLLLGGGDASINLLKIKSPSQPLLLPRVEGARRVGMVFDSVVMVTEEGELLQLQKGGEVWQRILEEPELRGYALIAIRGSLLALAGSNHHIIILNMSEMGGVKGRGGLTGGHPSTERPLALLWASDDTLLTSVQGGHLYLFRVTIAGNGEVELNYMMNLMLPSSKEPWATAALLLDQENLLCGDRMGSIHLYNLPQQKLEDSLRGLHGYRGVSDLALSPSLEGTALSVGRDGTLRTLVLKPLRSLSSQRLHTDWPASILHSPTLGSLIVSFHEVSVVVWSVDMRRELLRVECGGGHRAWHTSLFATRLSIAFIKRGSVLRLDSQLTQVLVPQRGGHSSSINAGCKVGVWLVTGGEDTTLRLQRYMGAKEEHVVRRHTSSVRALAATTTSSGDTFLVSGGGRALLVLWRLDTISGLLEEVWSERVGNEEEGKGGTKKSRQGQETEEAEVRVMAVWLGESSGKLLIAAAASDATTRLYVRGNDARVIETERLKGEGCVLSLAGVVWEGSWRLFLGDTKGGLTLWSPSSRTTLPVHTLGINVLTWSVPEFQDPAPRLTIATAGDDTSISLTCIDLVSLTQLTSIVTLPPFHCSQITGLGLAQGGKLLVSGGLDRKVALWRLYPSPSLLASYNSPLPDLHALLLSSPPSREAEVHVLLLGRGWQLLEVQADLEQT